MQHSNANKCRHIVTLCLAGVLVYGMPSYAEDIGIGDDLAKEAIIKAEETRKANEAAAAAKKEKERKAAIAAEKAKKEATRKANEAAAAEKEKEREQAAAAEQERQQREETERLAAESAAAKARAAAAQQASYDPNLWYKDAQTGCLIFANGAGNYATATWDGACGADGKAQGNGTKSIFQSDGSLWGKLTCTLKAGKCEGQGVITLASGNRYEGQYKDNKYNGQGVMTFASGERYEGQFKNDKREGQGVMTFADGERKSYEGQWKNDKREGQGVMTFADGRRYEGQWKDGNYTVGKFYYADGSLYYEGDWVNNKPLNPPAGSENTAIGNAIGEVLVGGAINAILNH